MADPLARTVAMEEAGAGGALSMPGAADPGPRVLAGRYEILGLVGTGGMGNVYRARDRELSEVIALKVLRPEIAGDAAALERFRREVKLARRVTHPNVARVFDIGDEDGKKFLTMELVDGESLGALLLRGGRLPVGRAIEIAAAVCAALGAAHAAGVVHCDLKPDNVLLTKDRRVVVTDFGIARAVASGGAKATGVFIGTPAYMAPEQVEGRAPDARTDIYALGAMLYELVTGEPPWRGESVFAVAAARLLHAPPDPRALRPEIAPELSAVVLRCMARDADERFADVDALARELASAASRAPAAIPSVLPPAPRSGGGAVLPPSDRGRTELAVLPLRNVGPSDQDYVADGITEDLIDVLSTAKGLRVRSRGTVMRYRGRDRDPREIGRELAVAVVVEGSIRRDGGAVRIAVRLVSVSDGVQIWHRRFDRPEAEIFEVSDAAAHAIAEALAAPLPAPAGVAAASAAPTSAEAIDLYLRARSLYARYFADLLGESVALFERALGLAPEDPRILAGYAMAAGRFWTGSEEHLSAARRAAERATTIAPDLADAHVALAMVRYQERREPDAIASLARALRISPYNAEAHDMMGRLLCETELTTPAQRHLETALSLEPELHLSRALLGRLHMLAGDWEAAEAMLQPSSSNPTVFPSIARVCLWRRDSARAEALLRDERVRRDPSWLLTGVVLEAVANRRWPALAPPGPGVVTPRFYGFVCQVKAELAMFLDDEEAALAAVEEAAAAAIFDVAWADGCPLLASIREHPRFRAARDAIAGRARAIVEAYSSAAG